jgi:hypothetical protein
LLIHGARAVLRTAPTKHDRKHAWALALQARRRASRAIVAIANQMARVICRWLRPASRTGKQCRLRPHKRCVDELTNGNPVDPASKEPEINNGPLRSSSC